VETTPLQGDRALEGACEGPLFSANPPTGRWTIEADLNGEKMSRTADVNGRFYPVQRPNQ